MPIYGIDLKTDKNVGLIEYIAGYEECFGKFRANAQDDNSWKVSRIDCRLIPKK